MLESIMIRTPTAGGIVLGEGGTIALVVHKGGSRLCGFPKGKIEAGETAEDAARREIQEETGLMNLEFIADLGTYERPKLMLDGSDDPEEMKEFHMFLFAAHDTAFADNTEEAPEWISYRGVAERLENAKDRAWYATVFDRVREAIQRD
jgi:ADP-ribose pyrophosphatase YjhB (NUDIX family)